jgi:general secretion pathway protein B
MSLILEALKKSEQQRRLGEAPTLGSPVVATRQRRSLLPVLAILIVVAAAVGWWLARTPPPTTAPTASAPAPAPTPIETAQAPAPAAPSKNLPTPAGSAGNRAADRPRLTGYATALQKAEQQKAEQEKRAAALANATHPTTPAQSSAPLKPGAQPSAAPPAPAPSTIAEKPAANAKVSTPASVAAPSTAPIAPPPRGNADTATAPAATGTATPVKPAAAGSALPTVWELPFATRKELPAIDLSMHVFAADPKQRFVVIKGERHVEGDEVGQDLVLREIRQDGLVLEYKGQAFFFPRNGR